MKSPGIPILVFFAIASLSFAENKKHSSPPEQTVFSAEDETVKRPVPIPTDVKALLSRDKVVQAQLENENIRAEELPSSWFSASEIHLGTGKKPDVIIVANSPVAGANTTFFWIFRTTETGHDLVLTVQGHNLNVKSAHWKGYKEIELLSVTLGQANTALYRFNGTRYALYKPTSEKIQ
jgi:hypothetical protein